MLRAKRGTLRRKERVLRRVRDPIADSNDLTQHTQQLNLQLIHGLETLRRIRVAAPREQAVQGDVAAQSFGRTRRGQLMREHAIHLRQIQDQRGERAADRVNVTSYRRPLPRHLRRLIPLRAIDIAVRPDAADRAQVNELHLVFGDNDVVRLQVVVHHPAAVQIPQRGQDLEDVGDGQVDRQQVVALCVSALA